MHRASASRRVVPLLMFDLLTHAKFLEAGHAGEWISGIAGAVGAITGAFVSVLWTEFFNRRTRTRNDRRSTQTAALSVLQKLNKIYSASSTIHKHYEDFLTEYKPYMGQKCLSLMGMLVSDRSIWFTIEERTGILKASGKNIAKTSGLRLINTLQDLDERFNFLIACTIRYGAQRQKFLDEIIPKEVEGIVGTSFSISPQQHVRANALDMQIEQVFPMAKDIVEDAREALRDLVYLPAKPLGKNFSFQLPIPGGSPVTLHAKDAPAFKRWFQFWKSAAEA